MSSFISLELRLIWKKSKDFELTGFRREVSIERAKEFQELNSIDGFFETSAKNGDNVLEVFGMVSKHLMAIHNRDKVSELRTKISYESAID